MTVRAIGYIRVSTGEQAEEGHSLLAQRLAIEEFCRARGWELLRIETDAGLYGETRVFAVVQLPPDSIDALGDAVGKTVAFTGCLEKVDGCMRNIYVSGGMLTGIVEASDGPA